VNNSCGHGLAYQFGAGRGCRPSWEWPRHSHLWCESCPLRSRGYRIFTIILRFVGISCPNRPCRRGPRCPNRGTRPPKLTFSRRLLVSLTAGPVPAQGWAPVAWDVGGCVQPWPRAARRWLSRTGDLAPGGNLGVGQAFTRPGPDLGHLPLRQPRRAAAAAGRGGSPARPPHLAGPARAAGRHTPPTARTSPPPRPRVPRRRFDDVAVLSTATVGFALGIDTVEGVKHLRRGGSRSRSWRRSARWASRRISSRTDGGWVRHPPCVPPQFSTRPRHITGATRRAGRPIHRGGGR